MIENFLQNENILDPIALFDLARFFELDNGIEKDYSKAIIKNILEFI